MHVLFLDRHVMMVPWNVRRCGQSTSPKNVTTCMMGADSEFGVLGGFGGDGGRLPGGGVQCNNLFSTVSRLGLCR